MTIVLDPAHGGDDGGARISDATQEKSITLEFAFRLRSLLTARGFNVLLTRDGDHLASTNSAPSGSDTLSLDDRAGFANHAHAVACLSLHATSIGRGVHLYRSQLLPSTAVGARTPWLTAQSAWVQQSDALEQHLASALQHAAVPVLASSASVRPLDSLTCPALIVELAPETDDPESVHFVDYQQQVSAALAAALVFWPNQMQQPAPALQEVRR
jgi:N-acetylmuramoyl-L-alanine amidase